MNQHPPAEAEGLNLLIYPSTLLGASRVGKVGKSLQSTGCFSETQAVGIHSGDLDVVEQIAPDVRIVRVRGTARTGTLGRILKVLMWQPRVYGHYKKQHVSAVAAHNVWVLPLAYHLSKKTGAVFAYNAHELETETIAIKGLKQKVARFIERRYMRHVEIVSVVNDSIADWYEQHYPTKPRPYSVTNSPVDDGSAVDLRALLGVPEDRMLYIHTGHLVEGRNIPLILETFASRPEVHVVFLGDGHLRQLVEQAAAKAPNIHWLAPVAPDSVVAYCRGADAGLCLIGHVSLSDKLSTPNKLMEALGAGIPSLSSDLVEARRLLGAHADMWVLDSLETEQLRPRLAEALDRLDKAAVERFKRDWNGIPSWDDQIAPLVDRYRRAVAAAALLERP